MFLALGTVLYILVILYLLTLCVKVQYVTIIVFSSEFLNVLERYMKVPGMIHCIIEEMMAALFGLFVVRWKQCISRYVQCIAVYSSVLRWRGCYLLGRLILLGCVRSQNSETYCDQKIYPGLDNLKTVILNSSHILCFSGKSSLTIRAGEGRRPQCSMLGLSFWSSY